MKHEYYKHDVCLVRRLTLARQVLWSIQLSLFKDTFVKNYVWKLIFALIIIIVQSSQKKNLQRNILSIYI